MLPPKLAKARARQEFIAVLRSSGLTYDAIGRKLGISRERARQIVKKRGVRDAARLQYGFPAAASDLGAVELQIKRRQYAQS